MPETQKSFVPNKHDIEKWEIFQQRTNFSIFLFRTTLLLIAITVTIFLVFLEHFKPLNFSYIGGAIILFSTVLFVNIKSLSKLMNKNNYYHIKSSNNSNNETQCIWCGSTQLSQRIKGTRTIECRCKKCKTVLFSHLDLSKEYTKNIDY